MRQPDRRGSGPGSAAPRPDEPLARARADFEQFVYAASHDLQGPLRLVAGFLQLLGRHCQGKLDPEAADYIASAMEALAQMQERIDGLVRFSRVITQGREFQPVTLGAVFEEAVAGLGAEIEAAGAVVTCDDLPTVLGDGAQLRQALQILISNAVKFRGPDPPRVHIQAKPDGVEWVFAVSDNGIGMAPEYFDRIFVIFQQLHTRAEYPGAGVGLAVCKRIVERHGGRMWVESEPGKGATFYLTLPRISKEHDGGVEQPSYEESLG